MIHRDLKSPNILLTKGSRDRLVAKVADFGLVKALHKSKVRRDSTFVASTKSTNESLVHTRNEMVEMTSMRGSMLWMAPEVFPQPKRGAKQKLRYTNKVDVYSFGIILWEALEMLAPWSHDGKRFQKGPVCGKIMQAVEKGERPPISQEGNAPNGFVTLVKECWVSNPEARPTFKDVLYRLQDMEVRTGPSASVTRIVPDVSTLRGSQEKPTANNAREHAVVVELQNISARTCTESNIRDNDIHEMEPPLEL